jgi:hypothetical protein
MKPPIVVVPFWMVVCLSVLGGQAPSQKGRIEGIVLQAAGITPQPVASAKITVTKVNGANGALLLVPGRAEGTSLSNFGNSQFPGLAGQRGAPPPPTPVPQQQFALPIPTVLTDRDGKFVVPNLDEGSYRVAVTLNGYVRQE